MDLRCLLLLEMAWNFFYLVGHLFIWFLYHPYPPPTPSRLRHSSPPLQLGLWIATKTKQSNYHILKIAKKITVPDSIAVLLLMPFISPSSSAYLPPFSDPSSLGKSIWAQSCAMMKTSFSIFDRAKALQGCSYSYMMLLWQQRPQGNICSWVVIGFALTDCFSLGPSFPNSLIKKTRELPLWMGLHFLIPTKPNFSLFPRMECTQSSWVETFLDFRHFHLFIQQIFIKHLISARHWAESQVHPVNRQTWSFPSQPDNFRTKNV